MTLPRDTEVMRKWIRRLLDGSAAFFSVSLVALYIQKSDGNSSLETILCIGAGALGMLLLRNSIYSALKHRWNKTVVAWSSLIRIFASFTLGPVLLIGSFMIIDKEDADYNQPPAIGENTVDGEGFALRSLNAQSDSEDTQISAQIVSTSKSPKVLNEVRLRVTKQNGGICVHGPDSYEYSLDSTVSVVDDEIVDAHVEPLEGISKGRKVAVSGKMILDNACKQIAWLDASFSSPIALEPLHIVGISITIPKTLSVHDLRYNDQKPQNSNCPAGATQYQA